MGNKFLNGSEKLLINLLLCSLIRNSELCSKLLTLDKSKSKTSFYLLLCSLIRNFIGEKNCFV